MAGPGDQSATAVSPAVLGPISPAAIVGLTVSTLVLCVFCVLARLYTRFYITRQPGWDDFCMVLGLFCAIAQSIMTQLMVKSGLGLHLAEVNPAGLPLLFKANYLSLGFFPLSIGFIKWAILLQFLRIFDPKSLATKLTKALLVLILLWTLAFGFISWVPCFPVPKMWQQSIPGHCYGLGTVASDEPQFLITLLTHASTNLALDFTVLGLAGYTMRRLGAERPDLRLRLFALMMMGLLVNVTAVCRMAFVILQLIQLRHEKVDRDPTYEMANGVTLLNIEINLSAICASIPVFWAPMHEAVMSRLNKVFVTREVSVVWATRQRSDSTGPEVEQDLTELTKQRSSSNSIDTEMELSEVAVNPHTKSSHYNDEFVQSYVDPLRSEHVGVQLTTVQSEPLGKKKYIRVD